MICSHNPRLESIAYSKELENNYAFCKTSIVSSRSKEKTFFLKTIKDVGVTKALQNYARRLLGICFRNNSLRGGALLHVTAMMYVGELLVVVPSR